MLSPVMAENVCDGMDIFGMKCCIEKAIETPQDLTLHDATIYTFQSGAIYQNIASGNIQMNKEFHNFWYFEMLERRGYTSLNFLDDFSINGERYTVALGQKCNHPEVRINGKQYRNDLGIFDIKSDNQYLRLYYRENGNLNAMRCTPKVVESETLKVESTGNAETIAQETITSTTPNTDSTPVINPEEVIAQSTPSNIVPITLDNVKTYQYLNQTNLYELVKQRGLDRNTDRKALAEQAGLDPDTYKGTKAQNLIIRAYLMNKISVNIQATNTPDITLPAERFARVQNIALWRIVGLRNYSWKQDRVSIAKEYGYQPQKYFGTRTQNINIRNWLLEKIKIQ
jgi:hypothetical protein